MGRGAVEFVGRAVRRVATEARLYDLIQVLAGANKTRTRLKHRFTQIRPGSFVVDIGGGTGQGRGYCPANCRYVCLDPDPAKLAGFRARYPDGLAIQANGLHLPLLTSNVETVLLIAVLHHVDDDASAAMIREVVRVLRPDGQLYVLEPVWNRRLLPSRLLWIADRGAYPRTRHALDPLLSVDLEIADAERFVTIHEYLFCRCRRRAAPDIEHGVR